MGSELFSSVQGLAVWLLGWLAGLVTAPIVHLVTRWATNPGLKVEFDPNLPGCVIETVARPDGAPFSEHEARYVRVRVSSDRGWRRWGTTPIRECRAYLIKVERAESLQGAFRRADFVDSIPLNWSYRPGGEQGSISLHDGIHYYADVFSTWNHRPDIVLEATSLPLKYSLLFDPDHRDGRFRKLRLTIAVCAQEMKPREIRMVVEWHGQWDNFRVTTA